MSEALASSFGAKWDYLRAHPAFRRAPIRTVFRLLSWRTHCALGANATIDLPKWDAQMFLPARWGGAGTTMIYAAREDYELELAYLWRFVSPGNVVVDAGASCGVYTVAASKLVGPSGRVLAFEPGAESFDTLKQNVELNHLSNVRALPFALSDKEGRSRLYHHAEGCDSFSLGAGAACIGAFEDVVTTTLDKAAGQEGIDRVDLLKMDVEGAEGLVLDGARSIIENSRPIVIFEVNVEASRRLGLSGKETWATLKTLGYEFYSLDRLGALLDLQCPPTGGNVVALCERRAS